jgi:uncharacterized 2Fe-2S/4Fe-4S cluster protein (DUF4445 family)
METYNIDFEPVGRRLECTSGTSILECARESGIGISSTCGGNGTCKSCKIQILRGNTTQPTSSETETFSPQELKDGWRLACQAYPRSNCKLYIPVESMTTKQRVQTEGTMVPVKVEPSVQTCKLSLSPPSLHDLLADTDRLEKAVNDTCGTDSYNADIEVIREISPQLRTWKWQCQAAIRNKEIIAILPSRSKPLGLAIDLGTTKIAGYLVDLDNGKTLASQGIMNPQISYGEDVINRLLYALKSASQARKLQQLVASAINELASELCTEAKAKVEHIVEAVVVGNTAMHHLFLGLPINQLSSTPFLPAVGAALDIKARDVGLHIAPGAYIHVLPNIAGYVGADHVAMLLAIINNDIQGLTLALDIGTNTEVSLINNKKILSVSCASGPAFEGGHIKFGMRAADGAIEKIRLIENDVKYETIGGVAPIGICGSAILDSIAQLYLAGIINRGGKFSDGHTRVRTVNKMREFVLVNEEERNGQPAITVTQKDIREIQLAKAAIRAGIQVLLEATGTTEEKLDQVIIAGAFGTYIDLTSAITIGMLPSLPIARFSQVGNAAGMGAKMALISRSKRAEAQALCSRVNYIELATSPNFNDIFIKTSYIGPYKS